MNTHMGFQTDCDACERTVSMAARYCARCGASQRRETRFERVKYWASRLVD